MPLVHRDDTQAQNNGISDGMAGSDLKPAKRRSFVDSGEVFEKYQLSHDWRNLMKTTMTIAALLAFGSGLAMAADTAPEKMTAAEMDKVVAGAYGPQYQKRVDYPCTTCTSTPIGDGIPDQDRLRDKTCTTQ